VMTSSTTPIPTAIQLAPWTPPTLQTIV
jgi:hypothetical protein